MADMRIEKKIDSMVSTFGKNNIIPHLPGSFPPENEEWLKTREYWFLNDKGYYELHVPEKE